MGLARTRLLLPPPGPGEPTGPGEVLPQRVVVRLLAVLAVAAGCLDVVCVTRLGGLFASVITGNLVQLGHSVAIVDGRLAAGATTAIGGYAIGVAAGSVGLRHCRGGWWRHTNLIAAAELVLLTGVAVGWLATKAHPGPTTALFLLAPAAAAMGVQSAITISSGVPGASTTYLTGTLTSVVQALTAKPHRFAAAAEGAARLAALLCGAAVGALALRVAPMWAPVLPAALVATVIVIAAALTHRRMEES